MERTDLDFIENEEQLNTYLKYLDELRESGETNMFGAAPYLQDEFALNLGKREARKVLSYWMETFGERHAE